MREATGWRCSSCLEALLDNNVELGKLAAASLQWEYRWTTNGSLAIISLATLDATMDVGSWLRNLGLNQYEVLFRRNEIDAETLRELTEIDLEKLGLPLGHRKRLLKAIKALGRGEERGVQHTAVSDQQPSDFAERRQLTVMFCDLAGSTALSSRLDPEDLRQVLRIYQDTCAGIVARYDGYIAQFLGDGIVSYFGFPRAHEDDAERAVRSGLEIAALARRLETPANEPLRVRVGISTGLVVVGDLVGQGFSKEHAVTGDTPNLAARLQALGDPGSVLIGPATRRLLGSRFDLKSLGRRDIKGLSDPVEAWSILGISETETRFEAAHATRLTSLVGREAESALLRNDFHHACRGEGKIVLLSGEAGIGKSRICNWLLEEVAEGAHTRLRYQCSPYHSDTALFPFAQQLQRAAGISQEESSEQKLDKLETLLRLGTMRVTEVTPLIAALLSIPFGERYPALSLSPTQVRRQTFSALLDQMEGLASQRPILMLFEDAHWADPSSVELLDLAIRRISRLPILLMITYRPEFESTWNGLPNVTNIALGRFDRNDVMSLIEQVTGGRTMPPEVITQIVAKTDGVPLFVEELTKNVLESGFLVSNADDYRIKGPLPSLTIPSTLQDSLMARLDRLSPVRDIAQIGAAIGRDFSYALLKRVADRDENAMGSALAQLVDAELLIRSESSSELGYRFKHALVRDTAYESLLKSRRVVLHRRIAEALHDHFPSLSTAQPELVAHHFTEGSLPEIAIGYWTKAGEFALRRSAFKEAIAHLNRAVELADRVLADTSSDRLRVNILYATAHLHAHGPGASQTTAAFEAARELAVHVSNAPERLSAYYGLWVSHYVRGDPERAQEVIRYMRRDIECKEGTQDYSLIERAAGMTNFMVGRYLEASTHLENSISSYDLARDGTSALRFGVDTGIASTCFLAMVRWALGDVNRSQQLARKAISDAERSKHVPTLAYSHSVVAMLDAIRSDCMAVMPLAQAILSWSSEHGMPLYYALGFFCSAWSTWRSGRESGLSAMREGARLVGKQMRPFFPPTLALLASAEAKSGDLKEGLSTIEAAITEVKETQQGAWLPMVSLVHGKVLLKCEGGKVEQAEEALVAALTSARAQKTRSFELRAAISLAELYKQLNRSSEARAVVIPALEQMPPGTKLFEIDQAQQFLGALSP